MWTSGSSSSVPGKEGERLCYIYAQQDCAMICRDFPAKIGDEPLNSNHVLHKARSCHLTNACRAATPVMYAAGAGRSCGEPGPADTCPWQPASRQRSLCIYVLLLPCILAKQAEGRVCVVAVHYAMPSDGRACRHVRCTESFTHVLCIRCMQGSAV